MTLPAESFPLREQAQRALGSARVRDDEREILVRDSLSILVSMPTRQVSQTPGISSWRTTWSFALAGGSVCSGNSPWLQLMPRKGQLHTATAFLAGSVLRPLTGDQALLFWALACRRPGQPPEVKQFLESQSWTSGRCGAGGQQLLARAISGGQGSVAWLGPGDVGLVRASARRIAVAMSASVTMMDNDVYSVFAVELEAGWSKVPAAGFYAGTQAYLIRPSGARKLLEFRTTQQ